MKKKSYKLVKGVIATALAGIMVTSFVGCHQSITQEAVQEDKNQIQLVNEENQELSVVGFVRGIRAVDEEKYGYINFDNMEFYDVLANKTVDLKLLSENNDIYYNTLKNVLTTEDYYVLASNGYIGEKQLKTIEGQARFSKRRNEDYYLHENYANSYELLSTKFNKLNFTDEEEKENHYEETTLSMNK